MKKITSHDVVLFRLKKERIMSSKVEVMLQLVRKVAIFFVKLFVYFFVHKIFGRAAPSPQ
jgi:hypothetical protein